MKSISLTTRQVVAGLRDVVIAYLHADGEVARQIQKAIKRLLDLDEFLHHPQVYTVCWQGKLIGVFWRKASAEKVVEGLMTFGILKYERTEFEIKVNTIQGPPPSPIVDLDPPLQRPTPGGQGT